MAEDAKTSRKLTWTTAAIVALLMLAIVGLFAWLGDERGMNYGTGFGTEEMTPGPELPGEEPIYGREVGPEEETS